MLAGKIQPQNLVSVSAPVAGTITSVAVDVGQSVVAGQLLAELSNRKIAAAQAAAKQDSDRAVSRVRDLSAELESAERERASIAAASIRAHSSLTALAKEFVRQQALDRAGETAHLTFLKARDDYQAAMANAENLDALSERSRERIQRISKELEAARGNLQDKAGDLDSINTVSQIRAPVDGVVIASRGQPGDLVNPSETGLFQIASNLSLLDVVVNAEPEAAAHVRAGEPATVRVAEAGDLEIPATVRVAGPEEILVGFASPSPAIRPGMTALVQLAPATHQ
jgi:multidrug resistance efflux pump